jgi:hypothetical protein
MKQFMRFNLISIGFTLILPIFGNPGNFWKFGSSLRAGVGSKISSLFITRDVRSSARSLGFKAHLPFPKVEIKKSFFSTNSRLGVLFGSAGIWFAACFKSLTTSKAHPVKAEQQPKMWHDVAIISKVL